MHYRRNDAPLADGELVVVDVGARYQGYCGDITRTYPVSGRFGPDERELYALVLEAQAAALERVKPGASLKGDVHAAAVAVFEKAGQAEHFWHSTSHHVGLEVHDPAPPAGLLAEGMVITVEPGLYFPERGLGIRIEDMVVVTAGGYELLSADLARTPEAIEALMARLKPAGLADGE
jgi:Xaa-Pro aminopeptidase